MVFIKLSQIGGIGGLVFESVTRTTRARTKINVKLTHLTHLSHLKTELKHAHERSSPKIYS